MGSAHPLSPMPCVIEHRTVETPDTVSFTLRPTGGVERPAFAPGQFNMLYRFGLGEVAISVSGDPRRDGEWVHTVRAVGKVSSAITELPDGAVVGVRGPYGVGWPMGLAEGKDVVVIAGGLGLAPLRPALYELGHGRDRFGRVEVIYGARTPKDLLYYREIQSWRARPDLRFQTTVDAAGRDWYGDVGLVTARIPDARFDPPNTVAFLCGPEIMMRLGAQALETRGVPPGSIWLSLERNMKCAIAQCGHCQLGPSFLCREGPVLRYKELKRYLTVREF